MAICIRVVPLRNQAADKTRLGAPSVAFVVAPIGTVFLLVQGTGVERETRGAIIDGRFVCRDFWELKFLGAS